MALILAVTVGASLAPALSAEEREESRPRLSPGDFKVFKIEQPVTGLFEFRHPVSGERKRIDIREVPGEPGALQGILLPDGEEILLLSPRPRGVGYEGILLGLLANCGQPRVVVSEFLPLGDQVILRLDALPPEHPCAFLEDPSNARLVVAATDKPVPLRGKGEIVSERTRAQIGLEGQPGGPASPIVLDAVYVEGGTEMTFVGRARGLDGSIWIEVEALVSPAPGIDPPRGYLRAGQLRVAASLTLTRVRDSETIRQD